jgi:hypothetical protein
MGLQDDSHTQEEENGKWRESGIPLMQYGWGNGIPHLTLYRSYSWSFLTPGTSGSAAGTSLKGSEDLAPVPQPP